MKIPITGNRDVDDLTVRAVMRVRSLAVEARQTAADVREVVGLAKGALRRRVRAVRARVMWSRGARLVRRWAGEGR